jgi:hypothetical protein
MSAPRKFILKITVTLLGICWWFYLCVASQSLPPEAASRAAQWVHTRLTKVAMAVFGILIALLLLMWLLEPILKIVRRRAVVIALSKQDAEREFVSFGNTCDEIKSARFPSGAPGSLGLSDDLSAALQCVHEAARQSAFLRFILIDPKTDAAALRDIERVLEKLLFTDAPAARKAIKPVERRLILARESLKGDTAPIYNGKVFPSAHEAAIGFIEDIARNCGVTQQQMSLPEARRFQIIGLRLALLPRVDGQAITGEMRREAVQASHLMTR